MDFTAFPPEGDDEKWVCFECAQSNGFEPFDMCTPQVKQGVCPYCELGIDQPLAHVDYMRPVRWGARKKDTMQ